MSIRQLAITTFTLSLVACGTDDKKTEKGTPGDASVELGAPAAVDAPTAPSPLEGGLAAVSKAPEKKAAPGFDELDMVLAGAGPEDEVPRALQLRLAVPSVTNGKPGDLAIELDPPLQGKWKVSNSRLISFKGERLLPGTTYKVTVKSLATNWGKSEGNKVMSLTTPAFGVNRIRLDGDRAWRGQKTTTIAIEFSAPAAAGLENRLRVQVDGQQLTTRTDMVNRMKDGRLLVVRLQHPALRPGASLGVELLAGQPAAHDSEIKAGAASALFRLPEKGLRMGIRQAGLVRAGDGYAIDVVCDDDSFRENSGFWHNGLEEWFRVSPRCELSEESIASYLSVSPKIPIEVSPARGGFRITGDFKRGTVTLRIAPGARTENGGILSNAYAGSWYVETKDPMVRLLTQGRYLSAKGVQRIPIQHVNAGIGSLEVHQVRPDNLVQWMNQNDESLNYRNADLVARHQIDMRAPTDELRTQWLDLAKVLPANREGLLGLTLKPRNGKVSRSRLLLTDINLLVKMSRVDRSLQVWALSMTDNKPLSGATIEQVVPSGRVLSKCVTGADGGCALPAPDKARLDKTASMGLLAKKGSSITYLSFKELMVSMSRHSVGGLPYKDSQAYRAAIYSDRGVYRPGDTARIAAILRTPDHQAPPKGMPVELRLRDARNRLVRKMDIATNEAGQVQTALPFGDFADTGAYRVELRVGEKAIGTYGFKVEEFVPERMKVNATMTSASFGPGQEISAAIEARYLFGGSAKGSPLEGEWFLSPGQFKPKKNGDYRYGPVLKGDDAMANRLLGRVSSKIGDGPLKAPAETGELKGPMEVAVKVAVLEAGSGRKTKASAKALIHPSENYLGLKGDRKKLVAGEPSTIKGIVVNHDGEQLSDWSGEVNVELFRIDERYGWFWDPVARRGRSRHYRKEISEQKQVATAKNGSFQFTVQAGEDAREFLIRVQAGKARTDLSLTGKQRYRWWWGHRSDDARTPKPQEALALPINLPDELEVSKTAQAVLNLPMKGRLLMTLETDKVLTSEWLNVDAGEYRWDFQVKDFAPNVYISAFLVRDPDQTGGAFLPARAFGLGSARVKPTAYQENITVQVPESVRSRSELEVKLSMGRRVTKRYVTVAVVDEGILQLTRFKTPDPAPQLFPWRALGVSTYETMGWNISIPASADGQQDGGGDGGRPGGRVQPVKPVALWSGLVEVPEDGNLTIPFKLPPYRGELRVMVMAAGQSTQGHAEASVKVADPLVIQATLPRFLSQGDELRVPVFVTNMSGKSQKVDVSIEAQDLAEAGLEPFVGGSADVLEIIGETSQAVTLADKGSATLAFKLRGLASVGAGKVTVTAKAGNLLSDESSQFPFLPAAPRSRGSVVVEIEGGEMDLKPHLEGWLPTTERSRFMVSTTPYAASFDHLRYLVRYPYGCIEQTTSSTRPLLYVSNLLKALDPETAATQDLEGMVQSGIDRIFAMQTGSGGFGYWPGARNPVVWGTAYAAHLLLDAKKLGYPVDEFRLNAALDWLASATNKPDPGRYYYYWGRSAYANYVLALSGRGNKGMMTQALKLIQGEQFLSYLFGRHVNSRRLPKGWKAETTYLLQAGLYLAGDRSYEKQLRNPRIEDITIERANDWTFYSDLRRWGLILDVHGQLFGIHGSGEPVAEHVARALAGKPSRSFSTQEMAWAISGLGRRLESPAAKPKSMELIGAGSRVKPLDIGDKKAFPAWSLYRASEYGSLKLKVTGKTEGKLYLIISSEGIKRNAVYAYGGNGLAITRNYRRRSDGKVIDISQESLKLGEVVDVELTLGNITPAAIQNIALVDRFAAGLEMETPRLGRAVGQHRGWMGNKELRPDHMNVRDDRIEVFLQLRRRHMGKLGYSLRATTAGRFRVPPSEAEAMYDPRLWARAQGGTLRILAPGEEQTD